MNYTWKDTKGTRSKTYFNVFDPEKDGIWCEMDVENKSSWSWSPCSIFLLTGMWSLKKLTWVREKNGKGNIF